MDLSFLRYYLQACNQAENKLKQFRHKFAKISAYSLYKCIATQSQSKINANLIRNFLLSFNWQIFLSPAYLNIVTQQETSQLLSSSNYKIHSSAPQKNIDQLLDYGIQLFLEEWAHKLKKPKNQKQTGMDFEQFCTLAKGENQLPSQQKQRQIQYSQKKNLFQCLMSQLGNLIKLEKLKLVIYYEYKNLADLFQMITNTKYISQQNIRNIFLSASIRKNEQDIKNICRRGKIPWDFNKFLSLFKRKDLRKENQKIHYSSNRSKKMTPQANLQDKNFTTPRRQKVDQMNFSTKLTKHTSLQINQGNLLINSNYRTPTKLHTFSSLERNKQEDGKIEDHTALPVSPFIVKQGYNYKYVEIFADLLLLEEQFIALCWALVKRNDFDLELVYERHGKKFQAIVNERYGVCNFSAFVRFIVPRQYEHRYLCFIRYQANNTLSQDTENLIDNLIQKYNEKEAKIKNLWKQCDKQMFLRHFCLPSENGIKRQKLKQIFSTRQAKIILQRLDPHNTGQILLEALN